MRHDYTFLFLISVFGIVVFLYDGVVIFYGVATRWCVQRGKSISSTVPSRSDGTVPVNFRSVYLHVTLCFWQDRVTETVLNKPSHHILGRRQSSFSQGYQYNSWWTERACQPRKEVENLSVKRTGTLTSSKRSPLDDTVIHRESSKSVNQSEHSSKQT